MLDSEAGRAPDSQRVGALEVLAKENRSNRGAKRPVMGRPDLQIAPKGAMCPPPFRTVIQLGRRSDLRFSNADDMRFSTRGAALL
jgi:hypothetical protein